MIAVRPFVVPQFMRNADIGDIGKEQVAEDPGVVLEPLGAADKGQVVAVQRAQPGELAVCAMAGLLEELPDGHLLAFRPHSGCSSGGVSSLGRT